MRAHNITPTFVVCAGISFLEDQCIKSKKNNIYSWKILKGSKQNGSKKRTAQPSTSMDSSHAGQIIFSIDVDGWAILFLEPICFVSFKIFQDVDCYFFLFYFCFSKYFFARSHSDFLSIASFYLKLIFKWGVCIRTLAPTANFPLFNRFCYLRGELKTSISTFE